jgi:hypothetical protein
METRLRLYTGGRFQRQPGVSPFFAELGADYV